MSGAAKKLPLVIGKSKNPRIFENFDSSKYVDYKNTTNAWMISSLFNMWLFNWNNELIKERKKILLVIDNASSHKILNDFSNIETIFLPPNTTGTLQPMDRGVIRSFKCKFTALKLNHIIDLVDSDCDVYQCYKSFDLETACIFISLAWKRVTADTIKNCFGPLGGIMHSLKWIGLKIKPKRIFSKILWKFQKYKILSSSQNLWIYNMIYRCFTHRRWIRRNEAD